MKEKLMSILLIALTLIITISIPVNANIKSNICKDTKSEELLEERVIVLEELLEEYNNLNNLKDVKSINKEIKSEKKILKKIKLKKNESIKKDITYVYTKINSAISKKALYIKNGKESNLEEAHKYEKEAKIKVKEIKSNVLEDKFKKYTVISHENRGEIIGTSNKNFRSINKSKPRKVRNDKTGNWRLATIATTEDILEYALSYYKYNVKSEDEIHAIVNFTLNTTTKISYLYGNAISVTIHEYVKKEEHDANKLFGGMVLGEYIIYMDNGDIEKIY